MLVQCQACFSVHSTPLMHTAEWAVLPPIAFPMEKQAQRHRVYLPKTQKPGGAYLGPDLPGPKPCSAYCSAHPLIASGRFPGHSVTSVTAITSHLLSNIQETNRRRVFLGWLVPRVNSRPDPGHNHFRYKTWISWHGQLCFLPSHCL